MPLGHVPKKANNKATKWASLSQGRIRAKNGHCQCYWKYKLEFNNDPLLIFGYDVHVILHRIHEGRRRNIEI